jgi:hypothetical protein
MFRLNVEVLLLRVAGAAPLRLNSRIGDSPCLAEQYHLRRPRRGPLFAIPPS